MKATITEHRLHSVCCSHCGTVTKADLPADVPQGAFGPRFQAEIAMMTGRYRMSRRETQEYAEDVLGVPISDGSIYTIEQTMSKALEAPYEQALSTVSAADVRYMDETSWKQSGRTGWLWVAAAAAATIFIVARTRGREVLENTFGNALKIGISVSDRYAAYTFIDMKQRGICHAHLHRDFIQMEERGGVGGIFGRALRLAQGEIFTLRNCYRAGEIDRATFQRDVQLFQERMHRALTNGSAVSDQKIAGKCRNILRHWQAMWTFVNVEGVEPTNNIAERALRKAVLWRKGSFGTRSNGGSRFVERMLTVTQTCRQNGRDLIAYLTEAIEAKMLALPAPALIQSG